MGIGTDEEFGGAPPPTGAAEGDNAVFAALYPTLLRFARVVTPIEDDPLDLLHDALAKVLAAGGLARLDRPEAYLKRTMVNLAANRRRSLGRARAATRRQGAGEVMVSDTYPSDVAALLALTPIDRAIVFLADVERLPYAEVAELVNLHEATVRGRASRARAQLREQLTNAERIEDNEEVDRG